MQNVLDELAHKVLPPEMNEIIKEFAVTGSLLSKLNLDFVPTCVAVDNHDNKNNCLYVTSDKTIYKIDKIDGAVLCSRRQLVKTKFRCMVLDEQYIYALDGQYIYATDTASIFVFKKEDCSCIRRIKFGHNGFGHIDNKICWHLKGLAVDEQFLYVSDSVGGLVYKLGKPSGKLVKRWACREDQGAMVVDANHLWIANDCGYVFLDVYDKRTGLFIWESSDDFCAVQAMAQHKNKDRLIIAGLDDYNICVFSKATNKIIMEFITRPEEKNREGRPGVLGEGWISVSVDFQGDCLWACDGEAKKLFCLAL
jgi:hypothetical protein